MHSSVKPRFTDTLLDPVYMEWGTPVYWGRFLLFCVPQNVKTKETNPTRPGSPLNVNRPLIWTPHYYGHSVSLGKESPYIFSKFNPLYTDTLSIRKLSMVPSVSVLTYVPVWNRVSKIIKPLFLRFWTNEPLYRVILSLGVVLVACLSWLLVQDAQKARLSNTRTALVWRQWSPK